MLIESAASDERHRHVPVGGHLAEVGEFFPSGRKQFAELLKTARPEFERHELAGVPHHRFATHLVQAQDNIDIAMCCRVGHTWREILISHCGTPFEMDGGRYRNRFHPAARSSLDF